MIQIPKQESLRSEFINLDIDIITQGMGKEIEYFEPWEAGQGDFRRGRSYIHGIFKDKQGITRICADTIWGTGLEYAKLMNQEGFFLPISVLFTWHLPLFRFTVSAGSMMILQRKPCSCP